MNTSKKQEAKEKNFELIYIKYSRMMYNVAFRLVRNKDDALEIVQEAFLRAMKNFNGFRHESGVQTWLYRIVVNLCYDQFRQRQKLVFMPEETMAAHEGIRANYRNSRSEFETDGRNVKRLKDITEAMENLTERQKTIFTMRIYQDLPYEKIAKILRIKVGTAKATFFQTVEKLRTLIGKDEAGGDNYNGL